MGHIPSNVLSTFRSAGGPVLQLPTDIAMLATLEYLAKKSLSTIGWETGYKVRMYVIQNDQLIMPHLIPCLVRPTL